MVRSIGVQGEVEDESRDVPTLPGRVVAVVLSPSLSPPSPETQCLGRFSKGPVGEDRDSNKFYWDSSRSNLRTETVRPVTLQRKSLYNRPRTVGRWVPMRVQYLLFCLRVPAIHYKNSGVSIL